MRQGTQEICDQLSGHLLFSTEVVMMCRRWVPLVTLTSRQKVISGGLVVGRKVSGSLAGWDKAINNLLPHRTARSPLCVCRNMTWEFFRTRFPVQMWQRERENREMQLLLPRRMRERERERLVGKKNTKPQLELQGAGSQVWQRDTERMREQVCRDHCHQECRVVLSS